MVRQRIAYSGLTETKFDGHINAHYTPDFIDNTEHRNEIVQHLRDLTWSRVEYQMYGKTRVTPRMTWCYGHLLDSSESSSSSGSGNGIVKYRGKKFQSESMPLWLSNLRDKVTEKTGFAPNACILNYYPTGNDHINWHADDEKFLYEKTVASISFQAERIFSMRNTDYRFDITLRDGSLLMMYDGAEHCLDAQENQGPRYNITFRRLNDEKGVGNYYYYNRGLSYALP